MTKRAQLFVPWVLGFFLVANVYLLPSLKQSPLATDALGAVLGLWLLWRFVTRGVRIVPFVTLFALSVIPLFWGLYAFFDDDMSTAVSSVRWLLSIPWGYALFVTARDPGYRIGLIRGLWWGCIANAVVLLLQFYGLIQLTQDLGLAAQDSKLTAIWDLNGVDRAPGMHYHPNASAAIVSLTMPLSLYLYYTRNARVWLVVVSLGVLLAGTQFTLTRSALLVSLATMAVFLVSNKDLKPALRLGALLAIGGLPILYWVGPPGGWQRWLDPGNLRVNSSGRFSSNAEALRLSLEHPLGLGGEAEREVLQRVSAGASHNAFLQIALLYGLLLAVTLALLMFTLALRALAGPQTTWGLEVVLAFHLFGLFLWEEHLNNPSFVILASWLVAVSATRISSSLNWRNSARPVSVNRSYSNRLSSGRPQLPQPVSRATQ